MDLLGEIISELTDFTGWVGFILLSLCLARLLSRSATVKPFICRLLEEHKRLGWFALCFLAGHGTIAYFQEGPELGQGLQKFYSELGTGLLTWTVLLITCLTTTLVAPGQFKRRHHLLIIILVLLAFIHIE